jgi:hypothetical protein
MSCRRLGPARRTLFVLTAEWHKTDSMTLNLDRLANGYLTDEILILPVEGPAPTGDG